MDEAAIQGFISAVSSESFVRYQKQFADGIVSGLSEGYANNLNEPKLVECLINHINGQDLLSDDVPLELSTRSIFIHGNRSQVEFDYYDELVRRELGDMIFIISLVLDGKKQFEKFTINQFKKENPKTARPAWDISNQAQLYLLARFPAFSGVAGSLVPEHDHRLPNYSGCLGSYGLLFKPGNFMFTSAPFLAALLNHRKTINIENIAALRLAEVEPLGRPCPRRANLLRPPFGNYCLAYDASDFSYKYLTLGLGEPTFMAQGRYNRQAKRFLDQLISTVKSKGDAASEFAKRFTSSRDTGESSLNPPSPNLKINGGGIGIVHTIINLSPRTGKSV